MVRLELIRATRTVAITGTEKAEGIAGVSCDWCLSNNARFDVGLGINARTSTCSCQDSLDQAQCGVTVKYSLR
jgi:hypothetical protein